MSNPLPPNSCLVAVILVVKTTSEPYIAFHYPPRPGEDNSHFKDIFKDRSTFGESTTSSSDGESHDSAAEIPEPIQHNQQKSLGDSPPDVEAASVSPEKNTRFHADKSNHQWNDILGFQAGVLARLLCPAASSHKKKFEVGMNDKVFVGRPMFARTDGTWRRKRKERRSSSRSNMTAEKARKDRLEMKARARRPTTSSIDEADSEPSALDTENENVSDNYEDSERAGNNRAIEREKAPKQSTKRGDPNILSTKFEHALAMFHVVFVLKPPPLEYQIRVGEMHGNVVKKFSKALKLEQARTNFVANEAASITSLTKTMNETGGQSLTTLYHDLLSQSSLARSISTLYNNVSSSRIAHVSFTPSHSKSFQLPISTWVSSLPTPLMPQLPGLWLTTANAMVTEDDDQTTGTQLGSHFTLLLLTDLKSILAEVNAVKHPFNEALNQFLQVSTPTKSFYQIEQSSGIPLRHIQELAVYLIQWRRARAIPPLNKSDVYILSPNADMRKLASAASSFSKIFPGLPSLSEILGMLSVRGPRPYSSIIPPTKDHKEAYMNILAWLMRGGWVTQLRSFAWVRVPSDVRGAVDIEVMKSPNKSPNKSPQRTDTDESDSASISASTSSLDVPDSVSSSRLDVRHSRSASPSSSTHTTLPFQQAPSPPTPTLISNPRLASALPSRYLSAISKHILHTQGSESKIAWDRCVKYFDGKHAIESVSVREGWKRKRVAELMGGWESLGVLVRGRHW